MSDVLLPQSFVRLDDPDSGLKGFIVVHSTALGPAAGGCRFWHYADDAAASEDALRLATGMSFKNALAGLPLGGGKAVIQRPEGPFDRQALFRAFGRAVAELDGLYVTAEDVGTSVEDMAWVAAETRHVAGLPQHSGRPGGDPSPWTAWGVFRAMQVAARHRLGRDLDRLSVAVQGLGHVGMELCRLLHGAGARLVVADLRPDVAASAAARFDAQVVPPDAILDAPVDIVAPCALGGVFTDAMLPRLKARILCGAANNQLADARVGDRLAEAGILYAPDYLVNAGGIINVAAEYLGWSQEAVSSRVDAIADRLRDVLALSEREGMAPHRAADAMALRLIGAAGAVPAMAAA